MGTYGRNFEFRIPPRGENRPGRYYLAGSADIPIGAPILHDTDSDPNALLLDPVGLATGAQAPQPGLCGIAVYEHAPAAFAGDDPFLTTFSDKDKVPAGKAVQMVSGREVKVVFTNTTDDTFLEGRDYEGRTMVAGMAATPTVGPGDFLTPGTGNDDAGYWAVTADAANAWLVVVQIDVTRLEVEARFRF